MKIRLFFYYIKRFSWIPYILFSYKDRIDAPIFLLGNQGDGITFISRILRRNGKIFSISGNSRYWTGADEMCTVCEPFLSKNLRLAGRILKSDPYHPVFSQPRSWSYGSDDLFLKYHNTEKHIQSNDVEKFKKCINIAAFRFGRNGGRFLDKSQVYTLKSRMIQGILKDYDPFFILITRNPYVSCYRAAQGKAGDMKRYASILSFEKRFEIAMQHWKNSMMTILEDSKYLKNFKCYPFEGFLDDVEWHTRDICKFLNIDFDYDMLPRLNQKIPFATKYMMRWFPVNKDVNSKYYREIDSKYFDKVEEFLGEIAEKFGYYHPLNAVINDET